ncbi:6-hydroxymethylpterin diphosphokinase MptE-like protein [Candidatus Neptunochlamydia vexilliferae]|uniref:6-hydroxymethylpterin diphosphokinase MptE-like protein n=1 Tax=Candidatus Neptunichlamydia vexilliferae TaxID=1651774 RepID=UPI0018911B49|nr:6-hydroxymethylpterin diphosphokinase MptE-like protein [Candidatus Neptunochlamydia vexilliferae]
MDNLEEHLLLATYRDFGIPDLTNVFTNFQKGQRADALAGKFEGVPAIICGGGPSLEKSIPALKKVGDGALVFGGGSALKTLSAAEVPIHFAAAVDPDACHNYFTAPLFYQNRVSATFLSLYQGPKLCVGDSGAFPLEEWLTDLPQCDAGWNVSTFAAAVAAALGCSPIYFVGMDLCVTSPDGKKNPIDCTDREGNVVKTRPDFFMAKQWLEEFAKKVPCINSSEGGLELEGIPNKPLPTFKPLPLQKKVKEAVAAAPLNPPSDKLKTLDASVQRVRGILDNYLKALEENRNPVLHDYELGEELFYQRHLERLWRVWGPQLQVKGNASKLQEVLFYQSVTKEFAQARGELTTRYYRSGKLYSTEPHKEQVPHGVHEYFYEDGAVRSILPYKEGKLEGTVTLFWPDGTKKREVRCG